jgi:hypothetical protein
MTYEDSAGKLNTVEYKVMGTTAHMEASPKVMSTSDHSFIFKHAYWSLT